MPADPRVVQTIRQVARRRKVSPKELLAAFETGIVESGMQNLKHGDADSQGWRQERASLYKNPTNLTASVNRFFDETGKVKHKYGTAGQLAAAVQRPRSDLRGRYDEERGAALKLLGGKLPTGGADRGTRARAGTADTILPGAPEVDAEGFEQQRKEFMLGQLLAKRNPNHTLLKLGVLSREAPSLDAFTKPGQPTVIPGTSPTAGRQPASGGKGADAALGWALGKIGNKETGENSGGLASFANQRFGMSGQPWCAMFTSLAATKGGAPRAVRTASVAEARAKAQRGDGYVKGFVPPNRAKAGDLIAFGTRHIGMVVSAKGNRVTMVAGNDSDQVQKRTVTLGADDKILRPKYR